MARMLLAGLALFALTVPAGVRADRAEAAKVIPYALDTGAAKRADARAFSRLVRQTLSDRRGWSLGGTVAFRRRTAHADFTIRLVSPADIAARAGCSAYFSCRAGPDVLINLDRWKSATSTYPRRRQLTAYRRMVVNHEVGHALGFSEHAACPARGASAPVMQQQSKSLGGCRRNEWPLLAERRQLAERLGVRLRPARVARQRPAPRPVGHVRPDAGTAGRPDAPTAGAPEPGGTRAVRSLPLTWESPVPTVGSRSWWRVLAVDAGAPAAEQVTPVAGRALG